MTNKLNFRAETFDALRQLVEAHIGSVAVLREAAARVDDEPVSRLFRRVAEERSRHASELWPRIAPGEPYPSTDDMVRKHWATFRSILEDDDLEHLLIEAERAEDVIESRYIALLDTGEVADSRIKDLLMRQMREVLDHHDLVREMRDRF